MGTFFAEVLLASPVRADRRETVKLLVDSGSMYTWVSATLLRDLGVQPTERRRIVTMRGAGSRRCGRTPPTSASSSASGSSRPEAPEAAGYVGIQPEVLQCLTRPLSVTDPRHLPGAA